MRFKPDCTEDSPYVTDEGGSQYHSTRTACCLQYTVQVFLPAAQRSACWRETSPRPRLSPPLWERLLCDFTAFITLTVSSRGTYSSVSTCSTCSTCSITHRCWGVSVVDRFELHGPTSDDLTTQTQRLLIRGIVWGCPSWLILVIDQESQQSDLLSVFTLWRDRRCFTDNRKSVQSELTLMKHQCDSDSFVISDLHPG